MIIDDIIASTKERVAENKKEIQLKNYQNWLLKKQLIMNTHLKKH